MLIKLLPAFCLFALVFCNSAQAEISQCVANLGGQNLYVQFDTDSVEYRSFREKWSPLAPDCPAEAIIARLKPEVPPEHRDGYCLLTDPETGAYVGAITGTGDRFGRCPTEGAICKVVNNSKTLLNSSVIAAKEVILGSNAALTAAGISVVEHSSKALILTGTGGYIAGTLGSAATTAVSVFTAPATATGVAAGAVVIGGAILLCGK